MQNKSIFHNYQGYYLSTLAALSGSVFFIAYKKGLETMTAEVYTMAVYITGFFIHFMGSAVKKEKLRLNRLTFASAIIMAVLSILGNYAIGKALEGIGPSITAVIMRSQIILVMFLGWLVLKEHLNRYLVPGATIAIAGFVWMNYSPEKQNFDEIQYYLWAILAAFTFGLTQIMVKSIIYKINPIVMNQLRMLFGVVIIGVFPGVLSALLKLNFFEWTLATLSAFFGPSLARVLQMYALRYIPVSQAILFSMLSPIFALILSWLILGVFPNAQQMVGAGIILLGISFPIVNMVLSQEEKK